MIRTTKAEWQALKKVAKLAFELKEAAINNQLANIPVIIGKLDKALKQVEHLI